MAREKCGHLAFPRSVRLQLSSALTVREEYVTYFFAGTSSAQRDKIAFHYSQVTLMLSTDINITETTYSCQFQYEFGNQ